MRRKILVFYYRVKNKWRRRQELRGEYDSIYGLDFGWWYRRR